MAEKPKDRFALSRNFLATDETPDTLFGIPVVADRSQYTPEDLAFFRKHPEAGGYYDMGDREGAAEEPPMQAASKAGTATEMSEEDRVARVNAGIAKHPGFSKEDIEDMRKSAAFIADPKNAIRGLLVEGTLKHDAERPVFYSQNDWEGGQRGFQGDRFSMASSLDDGRVVVFPSIYADKDGVTRLHTGRDAFDHYQKTGEHFGIYDSVENANRAAEWSHHAGNAGWLKRHERQQDNNGGQAKKKIPPIVKGPIRYGPPPPPSRGKYPGVANNPGNVEKHERRADKTLFKGEIEGGVRPKRFANFSDPVDGLTAAATVLSRRAAGLAAKGLPFTIENYVPGYAPKSENDVEGYIGNLSRYSGFARDEELDPGDVDDMARLLKNVVRFESGVPNSEWFTDDEYRQAALAMQEGAVD